MKYDCCQNSRDWSGKGGGATKKTRGFSLVHLTPSFLEGREASLLRFHGIDAPKGDQEGPLRSREFAI